MPQALVTVEQGELGAGVRALAAHDDAGAGRVAVQVDHAGQLGDLGGLTQGPVRVQGGVPDLFGQGADRAADRCGDCVSDRETQVKALVTQGAEMCEERLRAACAVGADQDVGAVPVGVGDLREGLVEHGDVIGGGVVSGVARPQQPGHRLAGVDQETQQRVEPEAAFVGGCGLVFLGVAGDQRGVEGQDQAGQFTSAGLHCGYRGAGLGGLQPGHLPGCGAGRPQAVQYAFVDGLPAAAKPSAWRPPDRTPRAGPAERPDPRSPRRRQRASLRDRWRSGLSHSRCRAAEAAGARWNTPPSARSLRRGPPANVLRHARPPPTRQWTPQAGAANRYPSRRKCLPLATTEPLDKVHRPSSGRHFCVSTQPSAAPQPKRRG